jgi:hypothetical protein
MKGPERFGKKRKSVPALLLAAAGCGLFLLVFAGASPETSLFSFVENPKEGSLTIKEGRNSVLTYRFGDQLKTQVPAKYVRSCYIHPLFSPGGMIVTHDFPIDHFHHRGLSWTWPDIVSRGKKTQTWHPDVLRQHFVRWLEREVDGETAVLRVENAWKMGGGETVALETVSFCIHPAGQAGRAIDLEIQLRAVGGPLELRGALEENKGYGGLCFRGAPMFTGAALTTETGVLKEDSTGRRFRWADISTPDRGIAIFVSPDHPGFPTTWLIRNSYAGILNPCWPGLEPVVLSPDRSVRLGYRIYTHRGNVDAGRVREAYRKYVTDKR